MERAVDSLEELSLRMLDENEREAPPARIPKMSRKNKLRHTIQRPPLLSPIQGSGSSAAVSDKDSQPEETHEEGWGDSPHDTPSTFSDDFNISCDTLSALRRPMLRSSHSLPIPPSDAESTIDSQTSTLSSPSFSEDSAPDTFTSMQSLTDDDDKRCCRLGQSRMVCVDCIAEKMKASADITSHWSDDSDDEEVGGVQKSGEGGHTVRRGFQTLRQKKTRSSTDEAKDDREKRDKKATSLPLTKSAKWTPRILRRQHSTGQLAGIDRGGESNSFLSL